VYKICDIKVLCTSNKSGFFVVMGGETFMVSYI